MIKAAFYECDITPPLGGYMTGYYRKRLGDDVANRLYAKALVVQDANNIVAMVSIDACMLTCEIHDIVTKRIYEYTGIKPECVSISATHTHKGIPISDSPEINCFADKTYTDVCYRLIADSVILAYKRLGEEEVEISYGTDIVKGVAFNRDSVLKDGTHETMIPRDSDEILSPLGKVDESLNVLSFSKNGKKIGAIVNFSCHLDSTYSGMSYSGDYASVISDILKEEYGNDFVSLFLTGACGNVNHINRDKNAQILKYDKIGKILGPKVVYIINNSENVTGTVSVCKEIVSIKRRQPDEASLKKLFNRKTGELNFPMMTNYLYYVNTNEQTHSELYIQAIKIGDVAISVLPGEIYAAIGIAIKEKSPFAKTIIVENSNSYCGYIPDKSAFNGNCLLYESLLCCHSCHVPEASDIIEEKALELLKKFN